MNKKYIVQTLNLIQNSKMPKRLRISILKSQMPMESGMQKAEMRMRELITFIIRFKTTWEFILHPLNFVRINLTL